MAEHARNAGATVYQLTFGPEEKAGGTPLTRTVERLRPTLQRVTGQFAHLIPARETDEVLLAVVEAVRRRDASTAAARLADYYDGPLAVFHERLAQQHRG